MPFILAVCASGLHGHTPLSHFGAPACTPRMLRLVYGAVLALAPLGARVCSRAPDAASERTNTDNILHHRRKDLKTLSFQKVHCSMSRNPLEKNTIKGLEDDQSLPPTSFLAECVVLTLEAGFILIELSYVSRRHCTTVPVQCPTNAGGVE